MRQRMQTFFFQKDTALRNHDGHISVNEAFAMVICQRDCHIGVLDADVQRNTEDAAGCFYCDKRVSVPGLDTINNFNQAIEE